MENRYQLTYTVMDPAGNITALVEDPAEADQQPYIADLIQKERPEVEQVGFVQFAGEGVKLRMAGGEFCGNAAICAAALYDLRCRAGRADNTVSVHVSGTKAPVEVQLERKADTVFLAGVRMPPVISVENVSLVFRDWEGSLPLVRMEGISHLIIESDQAVYQELADDPETAEQAVREWCRILGAEGLGLIFLRLSGEEAAWKLTPLVYIPGSGTVFWERSCASGTAAAGAYLYRSGRSGAGPVFQEPGGMLRVEYVTESGDIRLFNQVALTACCTLQL